MAVWQTPLLLSKQQFTFSTREESDSLYDAFFELEASVMKKKMKTDLDISVDLNGAKKLSNIKSEYLISSKVCNKPIKTYPLALYPYENNILLGIDLEINGQNSFSLGLTASFAQELNVDRRSLDVRRIFLNSNMLTEAGKTEIYRSKEYLTGKAVLKPFALIKRFLKIR
jgi:hypothetical protein